MSTIRILLCLLSVTGAAQAQVAPTGNWTARANGPGGRTQAGGAGDGRYLYVFGGTDVTPGTVQATTLRFDSVTGTWSSLAPMPEAVAVNAGAFAGGAVYSFGKWDSARTSGPIFRYDIASNTWTLRPTALTSHWVACSAATVGSRIYVTGGFTGGPTLSAATTEYDPATDTVRARRAMPAGTSYHASAGLNGRLYALGGSTNIFTSGGLTNCFEYDPDRDEWTVRAPISDGGVAAPRELHAALAIRNRLYLIGGRTTGGTNVASTFEFNPPTNQWTRRADLPGLRSGHVAATVGTRAFAYGNSVAGQPSNSLVEFTPPAFGQPPREPEDVRQLDGNGRTLAVGGWTGRTLRISARLSDPDTADQVALEVQVKRAIDPWSVQPAQSSGLRAQGVIEFEVQVPAAGPGEWRYRARDEFGNTEPADEGWREFSPATPDFLSDQAAPGNTVPLFPVEQDALVDHRQGGLVTFRWTAAPDENAVTYEVEVQDPSGNVETGATGIGALETALYLTTGSRSRTWRVRATDVFGNVGPWSASASFRVVHDDRIDHAAEDATRSCGFGAGGSAGPAALVLLLTCLLSLLRSPSS